MKIGAVFPQLEIGTDPGTIREWAVAAESLGYDHVAIFDHVLGAGRAGRPGWNGMYDHADQFHEPLVLMGFLAAVTSRVQFATSVLVLPQRQAALVAKQAAAVDILSGGRLRLGVASGWNDIEFEALGASFNTRGARIEEQIEIMRCLWKEHLVTFAGDFHRVTDAGIRPLPARRHIPLWLGGGAGKVLRRVGRMADGWFANTSRRTAARVGIAPFSPDESGRERLAEIYAAAREAGRDPASIGVEVRIELADRTPEQAAGELSEWHSFGGITHAQFTTMRAGIDDLGQHLAALGRFIAAARGYADTR